MDDAFGIKSKNSALVLDPEEFVFFFFFSKTFVVSHVTVKSMIHSS